MLEVSTDSKIPDTDGIESLPVHIANQKTPTNKVQILHVINGEHYSGAERVQDLLASQLPQFGYEVAFACLKPGRFNKERRFKAASVFDLEMKNRLDIRVVKRVVRLIEEGSYQLVHAHTPRSALIGAMAARKTGLPFVFHVHSPTSRDSTRPFINWLNQRIENWSIRRAARVVTVSESLKEHMLSMGVSANSIRVVPNGVPAQSRSRVDPGNSKFVLGTVALFRPRKGTEVLLKAIGKLKEAGVPVMLHAVGPFETDEYENSIKELARSLGIESDILWTGFTDKVEKHLKQMDAFVLPSLFGEGLPMVVLEAMSLGLPVVASDVEGVSQAIRDSIDGLLVEPGKPDQLAEKLKFLISKENLADWYGRNAKERQRDFFSDTSMARNLARTYDELLRNK